MQRSATSAFTRVFDALWRCVADPGSMRCIRGSRLCGAAQGALHRVRDTITLRHVTKYIREQSDSFRVNDLAGCEGANP
jgi:hypothetical protein